MTNWGKLAIARPPWFEEGIPYVPDDFIPPSYLEVLGGQNRPRNKEFYTTTNGSHFATDARNGDVICTECGIVTKENLMHTGEQYRKFEGKEDRNHHGVAANRLMSQSWNFATKIDSNPFGVVGKQGQPMSSGGVMNTLLRNTHSYIEMNVDSFGNTERGTRVAYKDKQKMDAQQKFTHVADTLRLHKGIVQKAMEIFSELRDDRENVHDRDGIYSACMIEAFHATRSEGQQLLKHSMSKSDELERMNRNKNAAKKRKLHTTNVAESTVLTNNASIMTTTADKASYSKDDLVLKPMSSWDLDDVKKWSLRAASSISLFLSQNLATAREEGTAVIEGSAEEVNAEVTKKVTDFFDKLRQEVEGKVPTKKVTGVRTNRVDMGNLGIKYQGKDERGSGGAGGIGNSGKSLGGRRGGEKMTRTAGQVLMLKTSALMCRLMGEDPDSAGDRSVGKLLHKSMKAIMEKQNSLKRKVKGDKNGLLRMQQMKRKSYLADKTRR